MDFHEVLKEVTTKAAGLAAIIIGRDGIAVGSYSTSQFPGNIEEVAIEHISLIKGLEETEGLRALGHLRELTLFTDSLKLFLMPINRDYYLILAAGKEMYTGRARFILKRAVNRLKREF